MGNTKKIPEFSSEAEERKFWETHDSTDYINWSKAEKCRYARSKAFDESDLPSTTGNAARTYQGGSKQA